MLCRGESSTFAVATPFVSPAKRRLTGGSVDARRHCRRRGGAGGWAAVEWVRALGGAPERGGS